MGYLAERVASAEGGAREAIRAWRQALGTERVCEDAGAFAIDTSRFTAPVSAVVRPDSAAQVQSVVNIARRFRVPLYPVSTGKNWGYGTSVPLVPHSAIVDLSLMNRILEFDAELGVVTLEPGVTQAALHAFLQERGLPFLVPVTGAGPTCSILANALERGFGVTPVTDHFAAVVSLTAVLPNGEVYRSNLRECNGAGAARAYKWGVGPYLDGLFTQSNFGIVVDASIALSARPECIGALVFSVKGDSELEALGLALRDLITVASGNVGGINLMSRARLKMMALGSVRGRDRPAPGADGLDIGALVPEDKWTGFGSIYGGKDHYRATCRVIRRRLRGRVTGLRIVDSRRLERLRWIGALLQRRHPIPELAPLERLAAALDLVRGIPSTVALNLAYAKSGTKTPGRLLNPALDGCGLLWYSPIVPFRAGLLAEFAEFAERVCDRHGFEAPITLTGLSPRCLAATVPLLFDPRDATEAERASKCYAELLAVGRARGFHPYRAGTQFMHSVVEREQPFWRLAGRLKAAIDPEMILAPGRYAWIDPACKADG
jgi:4-cresol dehydrogenase (hydroxylating)